jgi:hypothetical protein
MPGGSWLGFYVRGSAAARGFSRRNALADPELRAFELLHLEALGPQVLELRRSGERSPPFREQARADDDFAAVRDDPGFEEALR